MTYPKLLRQLIDYIPAGVYHDNEKKITELADAIAKERQELKEAVLGLSVESHRSGHITCRACTSFLVDSVRLSGKPHGPDCIVGKLIEETE